MKRLVMFVMLLVGVLLCERSALVCVRADIIRWKIRRVAKLQRKIIEDLILAVDLRLYAQVEFEERSKYTTARRATLERELNALTEEMA